VGELRRPQEGHFASFRMSGSLQQHQTTLKGDCDLDLMARWTICSSLSVHKWPQVSLNKDTFNRKRAIIRCTDFRVKNSQKLSFFASASGKNLTKVYIITQLSLCPCESFVLSSKSSIYIDPYQLPIGIIFALT
jgi:hypothetical protein